MHRTLFAHFVMLMILAALCLPARAADELLHTTTQPAKNTTRVTIHGPAVVVANLPLRILTRDVERREILPIGDQPIFDAAGDAVADLERGEYIFEILQAGTDNTSIIALRSNPISVPFTKSVTLTSQESVVKVTHQAKDLPVNELAIRSAGAIDEARIHCDKPNTALRAFVSPGTKYLVNMIASARPTYVAGWNRLIAAPNKPLQMETDTSWNSCQFAWKPGTPGRLAASTRVIFPDGEMTLPLDPETSLITNRAFFMVGYYVTLDSGQQLEFGAFGQNISRKQRFEFGGGSLTPHAWAGLVWSDDGSHWTPHFTWRFGLYDESGYELNIYDKRAGVDCSMRRVDGQPLDEGSTDNGYFSQLGDLKKALLVTGKWRWNKNELQDIAPDGLVTIYSDRCEIDAVPQWRWQSINYLTKMERYLDVERSMTGKPGPDTINFDSRANTNNAKSIIGHGHDHRIWVSLPFRGYEDCTDAFNEPWFTGHEMLHTFGYNHGPEMAHMQSLVEFRFALYRWYMVDHPTEPLKLAEPILNAKR